MTFPAVLSQPQDQPTQSFAALHELALATVGARLFTAIRWDLDAGKCQRAFTSMAGDFPPDTERDIGWTDWSRLVLLGQQTYVANDYQGLSWAFSNADDIRSVGCESVLNLPVIAAGKVIGTVNLLHEAGYYTPARVTAASALIMPALSCFLLQRDLSRTNP